MTIQSTTDGTVHTPDTVLPPSLPRLSQPQAQGGSTMEVNHDLGIKHVSHRLKAKQYYKIN